MSDELDELFASNRAWAAATQTRQPGFFTRLAQQQTPRYMWIGCADSRVPANEITGLDPGSRSVRRLRSAVRFRRPRREASIRPFPSHRSGQRDTPASQRANEPCNSPSSARA